MTTRKQLATGLGGVRGSDYDPVNHLFYFVEVNTGQISVLDLICRPEATLPLRTVTMGLDKSLDLVSGIVSNGGDIRWDHAIGGQLKLRPQGPANFSLPCKANFNLIDHAGVQQFEYLPNPNGDIANALLTPGKLFCVVNTNRVGTNNWNYAKIRIDAITATTLQLSWVTYLVFPRHRVIGTGYTNPMDIKLAPEGGWAYVIDIPGNLFKVNLAHANQADAILVASGLDKPHQIFLDAPHGQAYIGAAVPSGTNQTLFRVDLSSGVKTPLFTGLPPHWGLLLTSDLHYAYTVEEIPGNHKLLRLNLTDGKREVVTDGLIEAHYLEWADDTQSRILLTEGDPANRVTIIDLSASPVTKEVLLTGVPTWPFTLVRTRPEEVIVCSQAEINLYTLTGYNAMAPLFLGIGLIPITSIVNALPANHATDGYATTAPGYLLNVKDAPFGGSLALMINHNAALAAGAKYYKVFVNQVTPAATIPMEPLHQFSDYLWDAATNTFKLQTIKPDAAGFYPVREPGQLWYNPHLGYLLNSAILANGLCNINIRIYNARRREIPVARYHSRLVRIDNQWPEARIEAILHDGLVVPVCQIVNSGTDQFTFRIVATDPEGHLLSWSLWADWGDNKSAAIASDDYSHHIAPTRRWYGLPAGSPPVPAPAWHATVPGDPTSTRCAHTFYLGVWDRVTNGYGHLHYQTYHKSITLWL